MEMILPCFRIIIIYMRIKGKKGFCAIKNRVILGDFLGFS